MHDLDDLRQQARERFLGRFGVIGVGETEAGNRNLLFLLSDWSDLNWRTIRRWATSEGIHVDYEVVGSAQAR